MYYIAKNTIKIRYKTVALIIKILTPKLFEKLDFNYFVNKRISILKMDNVLSVTRPTIKFIKKKFNDKLIIGAEIGVQRGLNSEDILKQLNIKKIFLIDAWDDYNGDDHYYSNKNFNCVVSKFKNNIKVEIIKSFSEIAVKNIKDSSLDFVYIDANHKYEYVYEDISLWLPKVKRGGVIGGHDVCHPGVLKAVKEFCSNKNIKFQTEIPDWYFVKEFHQSVREGD